MCGLCAVHPEWRKVPRASREQEAIAPVRNGVHKTSPSLTLLSDCTEWLLVLPSSDSSCVVFITLFWRPSYVLLLVVDLGLRHLNLPLHCLGGVDMRLG